jgi:hypothetical protein
LSISFCSDRLSSFVGIANNTIPSGSVNVLTLPFPAGGL